MKYLSLILAIRVIRSAAFKNNGYIELSHSVISNSTTPESTFIAVLFSTKSANGLIFWYGQNKGEPFDGRDFMALGIVNGLLEFSYRLNGEETLVSHLDRVDNGDRHVAVIQRNGNQASLELDRLKVYGETRPTGTKLINVPGNIFLGGAPNIEIMTGGRYTTGLDGCIHIVERQVDGEIDIGAHAVSGSNVDTCPE